MFAASRVYLKAMRLLGYSEMLGEMAERTKAPVSKTGIPSGYRGFESHSLHQSSS